jgi:hypothetical protein
MTQNNAPDVSKNEMGDQTSQLQSKMERPQQVTQPKREPSVILCPSWMTSSQSKLLTVAQSKDETLLILVKRGFLLSHTRTVQFLAL